MRFSSFCSLSVVVFNCFAYLHVPFHVRGIAYFTSMQFGKPSFSLIPSKQKITSSMLSGSGTTVSEGSESGGESSETSTYSRPYLLRSAPDAASAVIDYRKGDVEDGVVDSAPNLGQLTNTICSRSSLRPPASCKYVGRSCTPASKSKTVAEEKYDLPVLNAAAGTSPRQ